MLLAKELEQSLREIKGFCSARESAGRLWIAHDRARSAPPLRVVAEELRYKLEHCGYRIQVAANEPIAGGAAPRLVVTGHHRLRVRSRAEHIIVVPSGLLGRLREAKFQLDQIDLKDPSYDNVVAFYQLVQQSLFLARRSAAENEQRVAEVKQKIARLRSL